MRLPSSLQVVTTIFVIVVIGTFATLVTLGIRSGSDADPPITTLSTTVPSPTQSPAEARR